MVGSRTGPGAARRMRSATGPRRRRREGRPPRCSRPAARRRRRPRLHRAGSGTPAVDWSALRNPVLSVPAAGVKDEALVWAGGSWHMLFSDVTDDPSRPGGVSWDVATATSPDLVHWSAASPWPHQAGVLGVASPDIVRDPDGALRGHLPVRPGGTSSVGHPGPALLPDLERSESLVAAAPAGPVAGPGARRPDDRRCPRLHRPSAAPGVQVLVARPARRVRDGPVDDRTRRGPWQLVGRPDIEVDGGTVENYEFVVAAGRWRLVATSDNLDQPWLFTLTGDPDTTAGWLQWSAGSELDVPAQAFNSGPGISSVGLRARQLGLPLCTPARRPATTTTCSTRAAMSSPNSADGDTPRSAWPAAPTSSTGRSRPADRGTRAGR